MVEPGSEFTEDEYRDLMVLKVAWYLDIPKKEVLEMPYSAVRSLFDEIMAKELREDG